MTDAKIKGKFFEAVLKLSENTKKKTNIFQYDIVSQQPKKISVFRKLFLLGPKASIVIVNLIAFLSLIAIGFGIFLWINTSIFKQYDDSCNFTDECSPDEYLVCSENRCKCPSGMYFKTTCVRQLAFFSQCTFEKEDECGYGLACMYDETGINRCLCSIERYWDSQKNYCELKIDYNQFGCTDASQCKINSNLECKESICTCVYPKFWNGNNCGTKGSYLDSCSIELGCDETKLLNCVLNGDTVYRCDCDYTRYWSNVHDNCTQKFLNGTDCENDNQCRFDLGLQCLSVHGSKKCLCCSDFYWDGTKCQNKKNLNESCNNNSPCNENQGLSCISDLCECPLEQYHDGINCKYFTSYGLFCNSTDECDSTLHLTCNDTLNQCLCPETHFWNYEICVLKFMNGSSCIQDIQCDTTRLLSCDTNNLMCLCDPDKFWNSTASICMPKLEFNSNCNQTFECQDYLGLECLSSCECPSSDYWNGSRCSIKLSFGESCDSSVGQEPCLQSKNLLCNYSVCLCNSEDKYWNSIECVPKLLYGDSCIYETVTMNNSQCADYFPYSLVCLAIPFTTNSWTCRCPSTKYYDSASEQCLDRKTFRDSCNETSQCQDYFGLVCYSNQTCLCPFTKYWNISNFRCEEKLAYTNDCIPTSDGSNESCQNYAFLFCISNSCQCDSNRYYDSDFSACLPRSSHNQYCDYDDQCMPSSPRPLKCISNTCQCRNFDSDPDDGEQVYWSASNQSCVPCPTGYKTGYGYGVFNSSNRVTNRCYKTLKTIHADYNDAQSDCQQESANLITIRNIMEMNMIKTQFSVQNFKFIVGSIIEPPYNYTWIYNNDILVRDLFYCDVKPDLNDTITYILIFDGYCLTYVENKNSYGYVCEIN